MWLLWGFAVDQNCTVSQQLLSVVFVSTVYDCDSRRRLPTSCNTMALRALKSRRFEGKRRRLRFTQYSECSIMEIATSIEPTTPMDMPHATISSYPHIKLLLPPISILLSPDGISPFRPTTNSR
jgi:hypothetical protein